MGSLFGFLTSLIVMAISYLGNLWLGLPFFPFDIFDWLTRHLPGSIIEAGLSTMIKVIGVLKLGPTAEVGKLAEQVQAMGLVAVTGIVLGLALALFGSKRPRWLVRAGQIGGVLLWLGVLVVEVSLSTPVISLVLGLVWLAFLLVAWGGYLASVLRRYLQPSQVLAIGSPETTDSSDLILEKKITRRKLLQLGGAGLVSAMILLLGLRKYWQSGSSGSTATGGTPIGPSRSIPFGPEYTSGPAASPSPAQLAARIAAAPGTRAEVDTPNEFYRVDINTVPPEIDASNWRLKLDGLVQNPLSLSVDEFWSRPSISQAVTLSCISNPVGGDLIGTNYWTGVRLMDVLAEAGVQPGAQGIAITSKDGFYEYLPLSEAMDERTLLVYAMNGAPLTAAHGFPLRLYAPGHYGMKLPKWITKMQVTDKVSNGYWFDRGWSATAVPMTTSVIDTDSVEGSDFKSTGVFPLGGIAWSGMRGISKVEVQIDSDPWVSAELRSPALSPLTWVQWRYDWKPAAGRHTVSVRATDGTGALQDATDSYPQPEGATGINSVTLSI
jgi:DMSO/TMAO reductase YedYZ molybdopterin-dependent catalytic subunit